MRLLATLVLVFLPSAGCSIAAEARAPSIHHIDRHRVGYAAAGHAVRMVGTPYRFGGADPEAGFDCSGLVQFSYRRAGAKVPRSTDAQRHASHPIRLSQLRPGDLVFFDQEGKKNSHVGIYLGNGEFVHAPSSGKRVRRDRLDVSYWRKHISEARRFPT